MGFYKKMKKIVLTGFLALFIAAGSIFPSGAAFNNLLRDVNITGISEVILLLSLDDGSVILSRNETMRTAPASLTKIVTAILTLQHCSDLNEVVTAKRECLELLHGTNSSNAGIRVGEALTVEQLLYCLMLNSANEAATILADYVAGSQEAFVEQMNALAQQLGCTDTHFANVHGLDEEGHYTTAQDIAKITCYALSREFSGNAMFEKIIGTLTHELPANNKHDKARTLLNTNRMLNRYYPDYFSEYVTGVKTGSTDQAGDCIVAKASRGGFNYLCVVMRGQKAVVGKETYLKNTAFVDAKILLNWAFSNIRLRQVTETNKAVAGVAVEMARDVDYLQLVPAEVIYAFVPDGIDSGNVLIEPIAEQMPASITAPVEQGDFIVRARILYGGEEFAQVDLVAAESISRSATMYLVSLAKQAVNSILAKVLLAAVLIAAAIYAAVLLLQAYRKRRDRQLRILPDIKKK